MGVGISRDHVAPRTPMRCPVCDADLVDVMIRDLGGVTATLIWELHAGRCPEHGWFQAEVISRPPREIFPVDRPFGVARRMIVKGEEVFAFPTVFNGLPPAERRQKTDPFDPAMWRVQRLENLAAAGVQR
jgi:hypothetical protein